MWNSSGSEPIFPSFPMCFEDQLTSWFLKFSKIFDVIRVHCGLGRVKMSSSCGQNPHGNMQTSTAYMCKSPHTTLPTPQIPFFSLSSTKLLFLFQMNKFGQFTSFLLHHQMSQMFCFSIEDLPSDGSGHFCLGWSSPRGTVIFDGCGLRANCTWRAPSKIFRPRRDTQRGWAVALQGSPSLSLPVGCVSRRL